MEILVSEPLRITEGTLETGAAIVNCYFHHLSIIVMDNFRVLCGNIALSRFALQSVTERITEYRLRQL
jgi:hypothetical protein